MQIRKSQKQFFWLFFIIGFFLSLFLIANEFFSHHLFKEELNKQTKICIEAERLCTIEDLNNLEYQALNKNQKRIIELQEVVEAHKKELTSIFFIFSIFILIGLLPIFHGVYQEIRSHIKLMR